MLQALQIIIIILFFNKMQSKLMNIPKQMQTFINNKANKEWECECSCALTKLKNFIDLHIDNQKAKG